MEQLNQTFLFRKVMVIDDNEIDRYIARKNIEKYAVAQDVVLKESVNAAIAYLSSLASTPEELPHLIFLDIRMPEKDGFDFLKEYEQLPVSIKNNCMIMMLSTSLDPDDHERAKNNKHVKKFLNKPLEKEKLMQLREFATITKDI